MDWLDLLAVQGTLKSLLQHHSPKASILRCSAFFTAQLSHPYMTTGKTIALTRRIFVGKVMSLLFNMPSASAAADAKSLQSFPTLCNAMDCSAPGSSFHGIFQARVLEWGAIAFSRVSLKWSQYTHTHSNYAAKSLQSCPTLCDPIDGSPPGFPVPGILQARTLEWVAISFSNA